MYGGEEADLRERARAHFSMFMLCLTMYDSLQAKVLFQECFERGCLLITASREAAWPLRASNTVTAS